MGYRIRYSDEAVRDLTIIRDYYHRKSGNDVAMKVVRDIRNHIHSLMKSPFIGSPVDKSGLRALHHYPYLILYEVDETRDSINLISIPHGSQRGDDTKLENRPDWQEELDRGLDDIKAGRVISHEEHLKRKRQE